MKDQVQDKDLIEDHLEEENTELKEEVVVLDGNHMLAGKELVFDIEMVEIDSKGLIIVP
jgi:FKBP-type peptidyl-prolyl cis-trans isomerase 2